MIMIIKAIGVLFLDIAIYYVIGTAITERFKNRIKRNDYMKMIIKNILVYMLIYYIPVMIFVKTTPYLKSFFAGKKQCVSDYFLNFMDWKNSVSTPLETA